MKHGVDARTTRERARTARAGAHRVVRAVGESQLRPGGRGGAQAVTEGANTTAIASFIGFAVKKPREWFDTVEGDEGFELTKAVFAENASFFEKRIAPMFAELVKSNGSDPTGEALSPDSSAPVSQETKSTDQPSIN